MPKPKKMKLARLANLDRANRANRARIKQKEFQFLRSQCKDEKPPISSRHKVMGLGEMEVGKENPLMTDIEIIEKPAVVVLKENPSLIDIDSRKYSTMKHRCSNCNQLFDDNDPGQSKIEIEKEAMDKRIEISVYDAIAYIYGLSFDDLLEKNENDWESIKLNQCAAEFDDKQFCDRHSDSVSLCTNCLVPFSQVYNAHRKFNKVSTSDSVIQKAVHKLLNKDKDEYAVKIETFDCIDNKENAGGSSLIGTSFKNENFPTFNFDEDPETFEDSTVDPLSVPKRHMDHTMANESTEGITAVICNMEDLEDVVDLQSITPSVINIKRQKSLKKSHWLGLKAKQYFLSEEEKMWSRSKHQKKLQSPEPVEEAGRPHAPLEEARTTNGTYHAICCGQRFEAMSMFYAHKRSVKHKRTPRESCTVCNKKVAYELMAAHMRRHQPKKRKFHQCPHCNKMFLTESEMKTHKGTHPQQRKMDKIKKLNRAKQLGVSKARRHVKCLGRLPTASPLSPGPLLEGTRMCTEELDVEARSQAGHKKTILAPPPVASINVSNIRKNQSKGVLEQKSATDQKIGIRYNQCMQCDEFVPPKRMAVHVKRYHASNTTTPTSDLGPRCRMCGVAIEEITPIDGQESSLVVNGENSFAPPTDLCAECNRFRDIHLELRNVFCSICNIKFKTRQGFRAHQLRKHQENRLTLVCERCGKSSIPKKDFRRHMRKHEDEGLDKELFKCKECGKYFKDSLVLGAHITRFHREDLRKTYTCPTCGKTTRNMTNMRIHERVHDPTRNVKRPYVIRKAARDSKTTKEAVVDETEDPQS